MTSRRQFLRMFGLAGAGLALSSGGPLALSSAVRLPLPRVLRAPRVLAQGVVQVPLPGNKIAQFVDPLPDLHTIVAGGSQIVLNMNEFQSLVMPTGFAPANGLPYAGTWVWGYVPEGQDGGPSYIGPVIVATRNVPTEIKYVNNLGHTATSQLLAYTQSTDQTLHWADPLNGEANMCAHMTEPMMPPMGGCALHYAGPIPAVPHLHGGEVPPVLDGGPDAWFSSDGAHHGHAFYTRDGSASNYAIYRYPNTQEAAPIWFHDHTLGATRLNVYAGLAGAYLLTDPALDLPANLLGPADIVPLVLQDRMFDVNGQLFFPNVGINPEHPFWLPEFVGDTIVVNGKVWPYKAVDRKRYRLLFLNGSNARAYDMTLQDLTTGVRGPRMWVIGTDGGYLDEPMPIDPNSTNKAVPKSLAMMPGERYDVIVDFNDPVWLAQIEAAYAARGMAVPDPLNLVLRNTARTPFPDGSPAVQATTGRLVQFRVSAFAPGDDSYDPASGQPLRTGSQVIVRLPGAPGGPAIDLAGLVPNVQVRRQLTLNEAMGPGGPLEVLVNNTKWDGKTVATDLFPGGERPDFTPVEINGITNHLSELPEEGHTELWEIINLTADAHPIHLHLVQFQLVDRQPFDAKGYNAAYDALFPATATLDPMTGLPYPGGVFIGGYGPPSDYGTPNADGAVGGNPAVSPFLNAKKGPAVPPLPHEQGWKDTVIMYPGQVTRIMVRWAPTDKDLDDPDLHYPFDPQALGYGYVWHCHIIDHEDNEMMRPDQVQREPDTAREYEQGTHY